MALNIYLIRHGKTVWNTEGRLQGSQDSPLVEEGILGAQKVGKALKAIPFCAAYSSLQKRAQDTAKLILSENNLSDIPHFHHAGLNEFGFGCWEGRKSVEVLEHPEYKLLKYQPWLYQAIESEGETYEQVYQRAYQAFQDIVKVHHDNEHILVVSHGLTLTILTAVLKGLSWQACRDETKHSFVMNTAINLVEVKNGQPDLVLFNQTEHLGL